MSTENREILLNTYQAEQQRTTSHSEWIHRNLKIHRLLAEITKNRVYEAILNPLLDLTREMIMVVKSNNGIVHNHQEHEDVLNALISGDGEKAASAMHDHISNIGSEMISLESSYRKKMGLGGVPE